MKAWQHFKTVMKHKHLVLIGCFKVGLYRQGIFHDMSKFSPVEFWVGAKYFQGDSSPNNAERKDKGVSYSWLHHKGRNKHHFEYWIDYAIKTDANGNLIPGDDGKVVAGMKMPVKYVVEMFMDRVAASKVYHSATYDDSNALNYYRKGRSHQIMHPETAALLELMLVKLSENGEEITFKFIKDEVLKRGYDVLRSENVVLNLS